MKTTEGGMIVVRFVFTYMFVLVAVEFLMLMGGRRSDRDFFVGVAAALAVTIAWRIGGVLSRRRARGMTHASAVTAEISRNLRPPASRVSPGQHALHGPSPSR